MYKVLFSNDAEKFVKKLLPKHQRQVAFKIIQLSEESNQVNDSQHLKGSRYKRVDAGEYRIIYEVNDKTLFILLIGKRNDNDIYKKLARKII